MEPPVLAVVERSGFVESVHRGHAVIIDPDGRVVESWGDPDELTFPRSANKLGQAAGLLRAGLELPARLIALTAASHSGGQLHLNAVREILTAAGLDETALQTPPDYPYGEPERIAWIKSGRGLERIAMNCSGKHAGMLATCVANAWAVEEYLAVNHPVQVVTREEISRLSGVSKEVLGTDGCGAPVLALSITHIARMYSMAVQADDDEPARQVADAMRAHPEVVGGSGRDVTRLMQSIPGLLAKDGAEGVYAAALPSGYAMAVKIEDGGNRARIPVLAAMLDRLGIDTGSIADLANPEVLGGGHPVGVIRAV